MSQIPICYVNIRKAGGPRVQSFNEKRHSKQENKPVFYFSVNKHLKPVFSTKTLHFWGTLGKELHRGY